MPRRRVAFATIAVTGLGLFVALSVGVTLVMSGATNVRTTRELVAQRAEALLDALERRLQARLRGRIESLQQGGFGNRALSRQTEQRGGGGRRHLADGIEVDLRPGRRRQAGRQRLGTAFGRQGLHPAGLQLGACNQVEAQRKAQGRDSEEEKRGPQQRPDLP